MRVVVVESREVGAAGAALAREDDLTLIAVHPDLPLRERTALIKELLEA